MQQLCGLETRFGAIADRTSSQVVTGKEKAWHPAQSFANCLDCLRMTYVVLRQRPWMFPHHPVDRGTRDAQNRSVFRLHCLHE
jgi:hypothetical protein